MRSWVTTIGSITLDIMAYTDQGSVLRQNDPRTPKLLAFEYADKIESSELYFTPGGGAANTAVTFARMGLNPKIIGAVGVDLAGEFCLRALHAEGLSTQLVQQVHAETNTSIIINAGARNAHVAFVHRGASQELTCSESLMKRSRTPWLYVGPLSGDRNLRSIFKYARSSGKRVAWNPSLEQLTRGFRPLRSCLRASEVFIVNLDEAIELCSKSGIAVAHASPRSLLAAIHAQGSRMTVITMGHKGALLRTGTKTYFQSARRVPLRNKTGAGDAFGAGLVAGLIRHGDVQRALNRGAYNSAAVVSHHGAQQGILYSSDVRKLKL